MANKVIVFVVFAAVVQASLASVDLGAAKKKTLAEWDEAANVIYNALQNHPSNFESVLSKYLSAGYSGARAFAEAARGKGQTIVPKEPTDRYKNLAKTVVGAIATAYSATSKNLDEVKHKINSARKQVSEVENVKSYFIVAKSNADQTKAVAALGKLYDLYFTAMKQAAAKKAGQRSSVDLKSSKAAAFEAIKEVVTIFYGLLSKHG